MSSPYIDLRGDPIPQEQILGNGSTAVVLLQDGLDVKTRLRALRSCEYDIEWSIQAIRREQDVYRRLQVLEDNRSNGIVRYVGFSAETIQLTLMENGALKTYLARNRPSQQLQLVWFRAVARTLGYIHDRRVLVADIASRDFPLDSDLSIKFCDFSEASNFYVILAI